MWINASPQEASILYVDGHVRVYNGQQTKLPRHYVARQRLCLRATTDYWVNAMDGQPFFLISKAVDPGLIKVLEEDKVTEFGAMNLEGHIEPKKVEQYQQNKANLQEEITQMQAEVQNLQG